MSHKESSPFKSEEVLSIGACPTSGFTSCAVINSQERVVVLRPWCIALQC